MTAAANIVSNNSHLSATPHKLKFYIKSARGSNFKTKVSTERDLFCAINDLAVSSSWLDFYT